MGRMQEYLFARCIKLFLMAGSEGKEGRLPSVEDMAWGLRLDEAKTAQTLRDLAEVGVTSQAEDGSWWITNFVKRQESSSTERVRAFRERQKSKKEGGKDETDVTVSDVTSSYLISSSSSDSDSSLDSFTPYETAQAVNSWGDNHARSAERLYQQVTGQISIPAISMTQALTDLETLCDHYGKNTDRAVSEGKAIFSAWCNTSGKNGRNYSPTNTAWLGKWLEKIAPRPEAQDNTAASIAERMAQLARDAQRATR